MTDCEGRLHSNLLCNLHYQRAVRAGYIKPLKRHKVAEATEARGEYDYSGNYYKVLKRDRHRCKNCGLTNYRHQMLYRRSLHIHHIDKKGSQLPAKERNNKLDNLVALCWSCHSNADAGKLKEYDGHTIKIT